MFERGYGVRLPRTAPPRVQLPSQIMTQMLRTKIIECNEHKQLIGGNAGRLLLLAWPRQATAHIIQRGGRSSPMSVGTTLVCVCFTGVCTLVTRRYASPMSVPLCAPPACAPSSPGGSAAEHAGVPEIPF